MASEAPVSVDAIRLRLTNQAGTEGVLLGTRCGECGEYAFGLISFCQACTSADTEPVELSSRGTLYSYTVVWVPPPCWLGDVPYVLGQIELPEGPHVLAEVVGCRHEELTIGEPVELTLQRVRPDDSGSELMVYKWRPVDQPRRETR